MGAFWGLLPVYAHGHGFDLTQVGTCMSVAILGGAALQWPIGRWSDRHDQRLILAAVCAFAMLLAPLQLLMPPWHGPMIAPIFLHGGLTFAVYPILVAHLVDHLSPEERKRLPVTSSLVPV
ncbi:MAG: MFS transporter [Rhodanobacter sp.]